MKYWLGAALVSLAFIHLFLFVRVPLNIVLASPGEHASTLPELILTLGTLGLCSLMALVPLAFLLFMRFREQASTLLVALALSYWVLDSFLARSYPALDGTLSQLQPENHRLILELVLFGSLLCLFALTPRVVKTQALLFLGVLLAVNGLWVAGQLRASPTAPSRPDNALGIDKLYALSDRQNLLVVLMDTFQSDYLQDLLENDPALAGKLDGFTYFPDALGTAPTTFLSIPAIHSGRQYDPQLTMTEYFEGAIRNSSVLTRLAGAGFHAALFNPIRSVCPDSVACFKRDDVLRGRLETNLGEALYLLDISLMRAAPEFWKNAVLNQGDFLLSPLYSPGSLAGDARIAWDDSRVLGLFADRVRSGSERPRATFLHLMNTHPPYVLNEQCEAIAGERQLNRESALQQSACAMRQFTALLDGLRGAEVYDNTLIILLGDHGSTSILASDDMASKRFDRGQGQDVELARMVGSANPVLLIKAPHAKGNLQHDPRPAHLTDLPFTICASLGACKWETGVDLLADSFAPLRPRHFMSYTWEHRFWDLGYIPDVDFYAVTGPLGERTSWEKDHRVLSGAPFGKLDFSAEDDPAVFATGWGEVELQASGSSIRWAIAQRAELVLDLDPNFPAASVYQLNFEIYVPDSIKNQAVTLHFNGRRIDRRETDPGLHIVSFRIPVDAVHSGPDKVELMFDVVKAGMGEDVRPLTAMFLTLTIEIVQLAYDASYLELALRLGIPLATLDTDLHKAAKKAGVKKFVGAPTS